MIDTALGPGERSGIQNAATGVPPRTEDLRPLLDAVERATERVIDIARQLDDDALQRPSLLPGWTRAHVLAHLARNADGLVNLLVWARTGVEHAMYASAADRDADIEEGASRGQWLLLEDLSASAARFADAVRAMPERAWSAEVVADEPVPAHDIPRMRLRELRVHSVDLDHDFGFGDVPAPELEQVLEDVVQEFGGREDVPALSLTAWFGNGPSEPSDDGPSNDGHVRNGHSGHHRQWDLRATTSPPHRVSGAAEALLGWLLGRAGTDELEGDVPELPPWL
jgi:maleylpyruvate isomerase